MPSNTREMILGTVDDLLSDFLYYDRKEDEELPLNAIEQAVKNRVVSTDEIIAKFSKGLRDHLDTFND